MHPPTHPIPSPEATLALGPAGGGEPPTTEERSLVDELIVQALLRLAGRRGQARDISTKVEAEPYLHQQLGPRLCVVAKKYRNAKRCVCLRCSWDCLRWTGS